MDFKCRVRGGMSGSPWRMHIRRIKNDTVQFAILVGKFATIYPMLNIGRPQFVRRRWNIPPKHSFSVSNVCYEASWLDVKLQNLWKYDIIAV